MSESKITKASLTTIYLIASIILSTFSPPPRMTLGNLDLRTKNPGSAPVKDNSNNNNNKNNNIKMTTETTKQQQKNKNKQFNIKNCNKSSNENNKKQKQQ